MVRGRRYTKLCLSSAPLRVARLRHVYAMHPFFIFYSMDFLLASASYQSFLAFASVLFFFNGFYFLFFPFLFVVFVLFCFSYFYALVGAL